MSSGSIHPGFTSSATRAFLNLFESPQWMINILWLTVAALTQGIFIGQIMLFGWGAERLAYRSARAGERMPDIETNRFGDYLMQGLWPFLVVFVVQSVLGAITALPATLLSILAAALGDDGFPLFLLAVPVVVVLVVVVNLVSVPIFIRAMLTQDFMASFDFEWCKDFVRRMFPELIIQGVLFALIGLLISLLGLLALCVGIFPAAGIIAGAGMHLMTQFYEAYLSRGGTQIPSKLSKTIVDAQVI